MSRMRVVGVVGTMFMASAAHAGVTLSDAEKSRIRSEIVSAAQAVVAGAEAVDLDRCFGSHSLSADYRSASNGTLYTSRQAIMDLYRDVFGRLRSQAIRVDTQEVLVLAPDLAAYSARGTFTSTDKSGATTPVRPVVWTILWRREEGQWRMLQVHQSFGPPEVPR